MVHKYDKYTSHFKHNLLQEYRPGIFGCGFKALIPSVLSETFYSLSKQTIKSAYRKCGLMPGTDEYYDRP
jgi:hypothetical protein